MTKSLPTLAIKQAWHAARAPSTHSRTTLASSKVNKQLICLTYSLCACVCLCVCVFAIIINSSMSKFINEVLRLLGCKENRFSVKLTQSNVARCLLEINLLPRLIPSPPSPQSAPPSYHACLAADNLHCVTRYLKFSYMQTHGVCVMCVRKLKSIIRSVLSVLLQLALAVCFFFHPA